MAVGFCYNLRMESGLSTPPDSMSIDDYLALPEVPGLRRMLIRGKLIERHRPLYRNRIHASLMANVGFILESWRRTRIDSRGELAAGEVETILRRNPNSCVGIDLVYYENELKADETIYEGPPTLAVEILSPHNTHEEVLNKIDEYLACYMPLVWVVEPRRRTVTVYRPDAEPVMFNIRQTIDGDSSLPGLSLPVAEMFQ